VLLIATLAAAILVWRFTKPIQELSDAARRVAAGDFNFRVPAMRRDEMGALATVFNEMIARLGGMRDLETRLNLAERSAVVGRLASAIAHEIRNPLNYINLTLDHLRTSLAPSDPQKRATVERLTAQLKTRWRASTRASPNFSITRVRRNSKCAPSICAPSSKTRCVSSKRRPPKAISRRASNRRGDLPSVRGDAESLRSLFTNLIINAVQAMEGDGAGGTLTVTLSANEPGRARIAVADTGAALRLKTFHRFLNPISRRKTPARG
jgi:nitrogen fixation/metabolism regulation signal transduction histidine kinase